MQPPSMEMDFVLDCSAVDVRNLEGKLLTQIEAAMQDPTQRKALKDIMRSLLWDWAYLRARTGISGSSAGKISIN